VASIYVRFIDYQGYSLAAYSGACAPTKYIGMRIRAIMGY
jgi:hypothetical protein